MDTYITAEIVSNESIGEHVRHLVIRPESELSYDAGQFFMLRMRHDSGEYVERSYSVANYNESGEIEFVIRIEPQGKMSQLIDKIAVGKQIDMKGPFGRFGFGSVKQPIEKLVLVAGGVGISPIRSMVQKSFHQGDTFPLQVFYGFRTPDDFLFEEELMGHTADDRFEIHTAISEETDTPWEGNKGFISDFLEGTIFDPKEGAQVCICGPPPMVKATRQKLFDLGFERDQVHVEAW